MIDLINEIQEVVSEEKEPDEGYPPVGTPETALILAIDCDNYQVLAHTGRYMFGQVECAGYQGEEVGLNTDPNLEPGYYVMEGGSPWESRDWETGHPDDYGCDGTWRKARLSDFARFNIELPFEPEPSA